MIKLLRTIRNYLKKKSKTIGIQENPNVEWFFDKYSFIIGSLERAKEMVLFIPVLYKVVPWDYSSIYSLLFHWFKRMEKAQREDDLHLHSNKRADEIHLCVLLLERLKDDRYSAFDEHERYWGESVHWFTPLENRYSQYHSTRKNIKTEEDKQLEKKQFRACVKHEEYLKQQDLDYLFKVINKKHRGWWV